MSGTEQHSIREGKKIHPRSSLLGNLVIATSMMLVAVGVTGPSAAGARPLGSWVTSTLVLAPAGDRTLCKGEIQTMDVHLTVRTYRWYDIPGIGGSLAYRPNQIIRVGSSSAAVTVGPRGGAAITQHEADQFYSSAEFTLTASEVGTSEITVSDRGSAVTAEPADRPRANPETFTVTVKECKFRITLNSKWIIPAGFLPHMDSMLTAEITPDENGSFNVPAIPVQNTAWPGWTVCSGGMESTPNTATLDGKVDWKARRLTVFVNYTPVWASTTISCPRAAGGQQDAGQPLELKPEEWGAIGDSRGFSTESPHTLIARPTNGLGTTKIIVERIYPN